MSVFVGVLIRDFTTRSWRLLTMCRQGRLFHPICLIFYRDGR